MKLSNAEIRALKSIIKKIDYERKSSKIRINTRRKSQLEGKTITKLIQKKRKPFINRRAPKRRSSIR